MLTRLKSAALLTLLAAGTLHAAALPSGISKQLPQGFEVKSFASGALDDSGRPGYLVTLQASHPPSGSPLLRPLLLFTQNAHGRYQLRARNDHVIRCEDDDFPCYPDQTRADITIKKRYFTVENQVAMGGHWTDFITFHWDEKRNNWLFHKEIYQDWDLNPDPDGATFVRVTDKVDKSKPHHPVTFAAWRPSN